MPNLTLPPAEEIVKRMIEGLRKRRPQRPRRIPAPLWSRFGQLAGHGCGYSSAICTTYGFNPDEIWRPDNG